MVKIQYKKYFIHDKQIPYKDKHIAQNSSTKFLGLIINVTLSLKNHIDYLKAKKFSARFAIRTVKSLLSMDALKMLYFSDIHSVMTYDVI